MLLLRQSSPQTHGDQDTARIMQLVLLATIPGVLSLTAFFGAGTLVNIILASAFAGKMAEQDPSDEPASELLNRIAQELDRLHDAGPRV